MLNNLLFTFLTASILISQVAKSLTINTNEIRDLEDTTSYLETEASPWVITNPAAGSTTKTSTCDTERLLGGSGITGVGTVFTRTYTTLPTHTIIQFAITFTVIDYSSGTNLFKISLGGTQVGTWDSNSFSNLFGGSLSYASTRPNCGGSQTDYSDILIKSEIAHSGSSVTLVITSLYTSGNTFSFGFRDVNLLFKTSGTTSTSTCSFTSNLASGVSCFCGTPTSAQYDQSGLFGCASCNTACASCKDSSANTDCASCASGYSWNGANCYKCDSSCAQCSGTLATQCVRCPTNSFLYWNNTCASTCTAPLVQGSQGMYKTCALPCGSNYYYDNVTCDSACNSPFLKVSYGDLKLCNFPCPAGQYYYWDTTCGACGFPLVQKTKGVERYCELPCGTGYYYQNNTCSSGCDQNFVVSSQGSLKYCNFTCTGSNFLYWNGSCYSGCLSPLIQVIQGMARYCQFPCASKTDFYYAQNGSCLSSCDAGFLQPTQGDLKYCNFPCSGSDFLYWNGSCYSGCLSPHKQDIRGLGRYCWLPCPSNQFYYAQNGSCLSSCDSGFLQPTQGDLKYCNFPCSGSDFLYWNGSCYSGCLAPHQQDIRGLGRYCNLPCASASDFYYAQNGSCKSTCDTGFLKPTQGDLKYCNFPCSGSDFLYWNGSCYSGCLAPLQQDIRGLGRYCYLPCATTTDFYYAQNGSCLSSCDSGFLQPTQGDLKYCNFPCSGSDFLYWNGSCYSSCLAPLQQDIRGLGRYCWLPCPSNQFYYQNGSCLSSCDSGFLQPTQGDLKYCNFPCSGSDFLYWNGSCYSSCLAPLQQDIRGLGRYCWLPCPANQFYYSQNNSCLSTCDQGFLTPTQGDLKYCNFPCLSTEFLYWNGSCYSSCLAPHNQDIRGLGRYCWLPCSANQFYYAQNNTCLSACDTGFLQPTQGDLKYCNFPCSSSEYLDWNNVCQTNCDPPLIKDIRGLGRYCLRPCLANEFRYQNGSCLLSCDTGFTASTQGGLQFCNFNCSNYDFLYWNGSCDSSCLAPLQQDIRGLGRFCWLPCPSNQFYYAQNNSCYSTCDQDFLQPTQGDLKYCNFPCLSTEFLYPDKVCYSSCSSPLVAVSPGVADYCFSPCHSNSEFINSNGTCTTDCNLPYVQVSQGGMKFCNYPCPSGEYLYWDNTCNSFCPTTYQASQDGVKTCQFHCPTNKFLYWNQTCWPTCDSPLVQNIDSQSYKECEKPCRTNEYLQNNGSCKTKCPYQVQTDQDGITHCVYPCTPSEYYSNRGSKGYKCETSCYYPRVTLSITQNETLCNQPCPSKQYFSLVDLRCVDFCEYPQSAKQNETLRLCVGGSLADDPLVKGTINIAKIISSATGLFRPCSMNSLFTIALAKMVKYVRYIDVSIPEEIRQALDASNTSTFSFSSAFSFSMPSGLDNSLQDHPLPKPFQGRGITSSYLKNQWDSFSTLFILLAIALIVLGIEFLLRKKHPHRNFNRIIRRLKMITKWNLLACLIFNIYDDFTLYFILEMYTLHINNFASFFSFALCLIMTSFAAYMLFDLYRLWKDWKINKIQVHPKDNNLLENQVTVFYKTWSRFQVLHSGFKTSNFFEKSYIFIFTTRIVILYAVVGFMYKAPMAQTTIFLLMSFAMFYIILRYKPFKKQINAYFTLAFETLILAVNFCLFILAAADANDPKLTLFKVNLSKAILILNVMIWIISAVYLIHCIVSCMLDCYYVCKTPGKFRKTVWLNLIACIYFNPGMGFDELSNQDLDCPPIPQSKIIPVRPEEKLEVQDLTSPPVTDRRPLNDTSALGGKSHFKQNSMLPSFNEISAIDSPRTEKGLLSPHDEHSPIFGGGAKSRLHHPSNRILLNSISSRLAAKKGGLVEEESPEPQKNRREKLSHRIKKLFVEQGEDVKDSAFDHFQLDTGSPHQSVGSPKEPNLFNQFSAMPDSDVDQNKSLEITDVPTQPTSRRELVHSKSARSLKPSRFNLTPKIQPIPEDSGDSAVLNHMIIKKKDENLGHVFEKVDIFVLNNSER